MFDAIKRVFSKDEVLRFNLSTLAKENGLFADIYQSGQHFVLEIHDPLEDLIDVFYLSSREVAISYLEEIKDNLKDVTNKRKERFKLQIQQATLDLVACHKLKSFHLMKFIAIKYMRKVEHCPKHKKELISELEIYFKD